MKGQGSTEYLVILAVVLVVALIVIGLLGQFTGFGTAGLEQQSRAYWQGVSPFSITNAKVDSSGVALEMQNKLSQQLILTGVSFDGTAINGSLGNITFAPGQTVTVVGNVTPCAGLTTGATYQVNTVVLTYNVGGITGQTQTGDKPLYGKCS
ncbi:Uncharacterised protein [uncultured archaeon]|nr:Uncharacterised protein [uncultured archaeon]